MSQETSMQVRQEDEGGVLAPGEGPLQAPTG